MQRNGISTKGNIMIKERKSITRLDCKEWETKNEGENEHLNKNCHGGHKS